MAWWLWVILGVIAYAIILLIGYALCKAADREDRRRGYK